MGGIGPGDSAGDDCMDIRSSARRQRTLSGWPVVFPGGMENHLVEGTFRSVLPGAIVQGGVDQYRRDSNFRQCADRPVQLDAGRRGPSRAPLKMVIRRWLAHPCTRGLDIDDPRL